MATKPLDLSLVAGEIQEIWSQRNPNKAPWVCWVGHEIPQKNGNSGIKILYWLTAEIVQKLAT